MVAEWCAITLLVGASVVGSSPIRCCIVNWYCGMFRSVAICCFSWLLLGVLGQLSSRCSTVSSAPWQNLHSWGMFFFRFLLRYCLVAAWLVLSLDRATSTDLVRPILVNCLAFVDTLGTFAKCVRPFCTSIYSRCHVCHLCSSVLLISSSNPPFIACWCC